MAYSELGLAERFIRQHPELLREAVPEFVMTEQSGRSTSGTLLQIAYKEGDVPYKPDHPSMVTLLESLMRELLPDGEAEIARQKSELDMSELPAFDFAAITAAIINADERDVEDAFELRDRNTPLKRALDIFRQQFHDFSLRQKRYNRQNIINVIECFRSRTYMRSKSMDLCSAILLGTMLKRVRRGAFTSLQITKHRVTHWRAATAAMVSSLGPSLPRWSGILLTSLCDVVMACGWVRGLG